MDRLLTLMPKGGWMGYNIYCPEEGGGIQSFMSRGGWLDYQLSCLEEGGWVSNFHVQGRVDALSCFMFRGG